MAHECMLDYRSSARTMEEFVALALDAFAERARAEARKKALEDVRNAADKFNDIIETIEARCMASDGPVTPTLKEMSEKELRALWKQVRRLRALAHNEGKEDA